MITKTAWHCTRITYCIMFGFDHWLLLDEHRSFRRHQKLSNILLHATTQYTDLSVPSSSALP